MTKFPEDGYVRHKAYLDVLGGELWLAEDSNGIVYFPLKPSCMYIGIDFDTSLDTIKSDSRLAPGLSPIKLPSAGGLQPHQCLRKLEYTWWLAIIDPRRFREERRSGIIERQRILMQFAEDVMLSNGRLDNIATRRLARTRNDVEVSGEGLEGYMRCKKCGTPHIIVIDGAGWHVHLGVEIES